MSVPKIRKNCVFGVMCKRLHDRNLILTQQRLVQNHDYDPFYDKTEEIVGETLETGESVIQAIRRGMQEECGLPLDAKIDIYGAEADHLFESDRGERISCTRPLCYLDSTGEPQLWVGPAFLVRVPENFTPSNEQSEGEAGEYKWRKPNELLTAIAGNPDKFMGLHRPAMMIAARLLMG